jgi:hypothetical protein
MPRTHDQLQQIQEAEARALRAHEDVIEHSKRNWLAKKEEVAASVAFELSAPVIYRQLDDELAVAYADLDACQHALSAAISTYIETVADVADICGRLPQ